MGDCENSRDGSGASFAKARREVSHSTDVCFSRDLEEVEHDDYEVSSYNTWSSRDAGLVPSERNEALEEEDGNTRGSSAQESVKMDCLQRRLEDDSIQECR